MLKLTSSPSCAAPCPFCNNCLEVHGDGFVNRTGLLRCRFGERNVVGAYFASPHVLRCSAPAQSVAGAVHVTVSVDGGASYGLTKSTLRQFRYVAPSFVTGLSPRSGPDTGGTVVTVLGQGFSADFFYSCSFHNKSRVREGSSNGMAHTPAIVVSSAELTCIAPPVASGTDIGRSIAVTVYVDFVDGFLTPLPVAPGVSDTLTAFLYTPALQLTKLYPDRGSKGGGTVVEIGGANFFTRTDYRGDLDNMTTHSTSNGIVWCRFGTVVTVGSRAPSGITCRSPPRGVGMPADVEVSVSINGGADFAQGPPGAELVSTRKHESGEAHSHRASKQG